MRKLIYLTLSILLLTACDVHEWPELPQQVAFHLHLNHETEMTFWEHSYENSIVTEQGTGNSYDNAQQYGKIRYIVRAYPITGKQRNIQTYTQEFVFTQNISEGYDYGVTLNLPAGEYDIKVWSDLVENANEPRFYNTDNFAEIELQGEHVGNSNHRDAFRGYGNITLSADYAEHAPDTLDIAMQRPLAKYEFVTTDLKKFIERVLEYLAREAETRGDAPPTRVDTDEYTVVIAYPGYMPCTYNIFSDKPIDSKLGVLFKSKLGLLSEENASLGFDYVFVNGKESAVVVQVSLFDKENKQMAASEPINVPLRRNYHTILKGSFLMQNTSGGININPEFNGEHNIEIE